MKKNTRAKRGQLTEIDELIIAVRNVLFRFEPGLVSLRMTSTGIEVDRVRFAEVTTPAAAPGLPDQTGEPEPF